MVTNILVIDDEESVRSLLSRLLSRHGYACTLAADAAEARKFLKDRNFELILCDIKMPGESGIDLIRHIRTEHPDTAVIMVTAVDDPEAADAVIESGAYGYMIKPFNLNEMIISVRNSLRRRELEMISRSYRLDLEQKVAERTARLHKTLEGIVKAMALAVESRDPYTAGHQQRVADLAVAIAKEMNISKDQIEGIRMAGLIHDLGKISVPAEILSKPGSLTEIEFSLIKTHPRVGYDIMTDIEFPWPIDQMMIQHHERINGSGYPQGLSGEDIILEARVLSVSDVVEAMASHRPYRPALGVDRALEEISKNKMEFYDSDVVDACLRLFREKEFKFE